jgi:hypothetical protein
MRTHVCSHKCFSTWGIVFLVSDEELFADNAEEYIRRDIEGSDVDTRRRAACDLVRVLSRYYEEKITGIFSSYVQVSVLHFIRVIYLRCHNRGARVMVCLVSVRVSISYISLCFLSDNTIRVHESEWTMNLLVSYIECCDFWIIYFVFLNTSWFLMGGDGGGDGGSSTFSVFVN